jgi:UPF0755 protein
MKRIIVIVIVIVLTLSAWGLISSVRSRRAEREARRLAIENQKFEEVKITLIEGWTNEEVYAYLEKQGRGEAKAYAEAEKNVAADAYPVLSDKPSKAGLQGFLFPDTYRVAKDGTPDDILDRLLTTFEQKFDQASKDSKTSAGYFIIPGYENIKLNKRIAPGFTLFELVTLAAIVEKESGRAGESAGSARLQEERQKVAGVFLNRLSASMALQSDATINYITKSGRASSTQKDLEIDSPYNTYKYPGLPPGPIANVSYSSLYAVLHPLKTDFYYFLHSQTTGEVYYGRTLEEHNQNRAKYLR